jgi:hypothetical protein
MITGSAKSGTTGVKHIHISKKKKKPSSSPDVLGISLRSSAHIQTRGKRRHGTSASLPEEAVLTRGGQA